MVTDEVMKHEQRAKIKLLEKEREKNEESDKKTRSNRSKGKINQLQDIQYNNTIQQRFIYALSKNSIHKIKNVFRQRRWRGDVSLQSRATTLRVPSQEQDEEETSRKGTLGFLFKLAMRQDMHCK